ncbi:MAG: helix-turn-helix transcriptional regulator [Chloroflexi bacterium]|nr:helix-turn-helix transcriptional regulator [Chloroflexota bacterium]
MSPLHPLLGLLLSGERHGYELKRIVDEEYAPYWHIDFAQLYRSLAKMTRQGWVEWRAESGDGAPDRKVYSLTSPGRAAFQAWLAEPAQDREEFFVKLRLAHECGAPIAPLVQDRRRKLEKELAGRLEAERAAQSSDDAGRLALANAALRETEAMLVGLDLTSAILSPIGGPRGAESPHDQLKIFGSDDPLLGYLAQLAHAESHSIGSVGGLLALAQGEADLAGSHLLDVETGEYNVPFVRRLVPEDEMVLVNLAFRENGLMMAPGNPKKIRTLRDLLRPDVRFINRQAGAGTRLLLHVRLRQARLNPHGLRDWDRTVATHQAVADAINVGAADVGPGVRAVASAHGLEFLPLGLERFDLVIPNDKFESRRVRPILDALDSPEFRRAASTLIGYDLSRSGKVVARIR